MLLILVALVSPLAALDDQLVWVHMAQHLVLGDLAALLIVLGLTGPLLQPLLATRGLGWLRVFSHPAVALPLWLADLYLWHVPALYQAPSRARRCTRSSTHASSASGSPCGWPFWGRSRSRTGSETAPA